MEPCQKIEEIDSSEELASFIAAFRADLKANTRESKNRTLGDFLEAMETWIRKSSDKELPEEANWQTLPRIICASKARGQSGLADSIPHS
jgi:hypothetical protein